MILLITDKREPRLAAVLQEFGDVKELTPFDSSDHMGLDSLAGYYARDNSLELAVVHMDGILGENVCGMVRGQQRNAPIIWISNNEEFEAQSRCIPVEDFWTKPMPALLLKKQAKIFLGQSNCIG